MCVRGQGQVGSRFGAGFPLQGGGCVGEGLTTQNPLPGPAIRLAIPNTELFLAALGLQSLGVTVYCSLP
jgi:hypothetical protein